MAEVDLASRWQTTFHRIVQQPEHAQPLKAAALQQHLGAWTQALTGVAVATCRNLGWQASAKGHALQGFPAPRSEYLGLDVMAFAAAGDQWQFPVAVLELENSREDARIAYSLWKVLCVRATLRIVFCYRPSAAEAPLLVRYVCDRVVHAMDLTTRTTLDGQTLVVAGSRDDSTTFPYGFFKWWQLDANTGNFRLMY